MEQEAVCFVTRQRSVPPAQEARQALQQGGQDEASRHAQVQFGREVFNTFVFHPLSDSTLPLPEAEPSRRA